MLKKVRKQNPGSVPLSRFVATVDGVFSGLWPILCPSLVEFSSFWVIQQTKGKLMRDLHFFIHTVTMMIKAPLTERIQILWDEDWSLKKSAEMMTTKNNRTFYKQPQLFEVWLVQYDQKTWLDTELGLNTASKTDRSQF